MLNVLSKETLDFYKRTGYYAPVRVLTPQEVSSYRQQLEAYEQLSGAPLQGRMRVKSHLLFTWADSLVHHPKILNAVEDIIGPNILCWTSNFFIKEPMSPGFVSWHQDAAYWGLEPDDVVTAWVALTDSNLQSGCMKVMPGTHLESHIPHIDTFDENNMLTRGQEIAVEVDESKAANLMLEPGEMSLHHIKLVHGSAPNNSLNRRIGFAIRYIPTHVRQTKQRDSAMLCRGVDLDGNFDLEPRPLKDMDAAAVTAHADAVDRKVAVLLDGATKKTLRA